MPPEGAAGAGAPFAQERTVTPILNISCYKFVPLPDAQALRGALHAQALAADLKGTILLAEEGINFFLAGSAQAVRGFVDALRTDARFADLQPKESWSAQVPFRKMLVKVKHEIIRMDRPAIVPSAGRAPAVDAPTLRRWLARLHEDINLTSVFVTHDQEEAMEVADRIVVMNKGVIEQIGSPGDVYENPASDFVYHFLGDSNRLHLGEDQHLLFRPHEVSLSRHELEDHHAAEVRDIRPLGATTRVTLKVEGQSELIEAEVVKDHDSLIGLARGETLFFKPKVWQKA